MTFILVPEDYLWDCFKDHTNKIPLHLDSSTNLSFLYNIFYSDIVFIQNDIFIPTSINLACAYLSRKFNNLKVKFCPQEQKRTSNRFKNIKQPMIRQNLKIDSKSSQSEAWLKSTRA